MSVLTSILTDLIHFTKIILVCEMFFMFNKREFKNKKVSILLAIAVVVFVSAIMHFCKNPIFNMIIYCVFNVGMFLFLYQEKTSRIITSIIWVVFILALLDIMSGVLVKMQHYLFEFEQNDFDNIIASIISLIFV